MTHLRPVPDPLVTRPAMAELLAVSVATFDRMRRDGDRNGRPCPVVTWGRRIVRFQPAEVMAWAGTLEERKAA